RGEERYEGEGAGDRAQQKGRRDADQPVGGRVVDHQDRADGQAAADEAGDDAVHLLDQVDDAALLALGDEALPKGQDAPPAGGEEVEEDGGEAERKATVGEAAEW